MRDKDELIGEIKETSEGCKVEILPAVADWCSTGCTVFDFAISNRYPGGGLPIGRIVQAYGGTSTCKSVLAAAVLGYAQRKGMKTYLGDTEHTLDPVFAELYGLDCSKLNGIGYPETIEEFFDDWLHSIIVKGKGKSQKIDKDQKVVAVDSLTALPAKIEQEKSMSDQGYGAYRAKQIGLGFRKYIKLLAESNTTLLIIDQTRDNFGSAFGGETVPGGRAPEFYPSVRVYLKHDSRIDNSKGSTIGVWIRFRIDKNKVAPPFREGRFKILFDYGLDDIASSLYLMSLDQNGKDAAKNKNTKIKLFGDEKTARGWISHIEKNNLEEDLKKEAWKLWQEIHKTETRKLRVW